MEKLTQDEVDVLVEGLIEEFGQDYIDFMGQKDGKAMGEDILSILDDEYMTDEEKLDAIREYLEG